MFCPGKKWALVKFDNAEGGKGSYISYKPPLEVDTIRSGLNNFSGGQCPCIEYHFDYVLRFRTYGSNRDYGTNTSYYVIENYSFSGSGKIGGRISLSITETQPGRLLWEVIGTDRNCQPRTIFIASAGNSPALFFGEMRSQRAESMEFSLTNVRRVDGQADECGDPPNDCFLVIRQGGTEVFRRKGLGSSCPKFQVGCSDDCPEGMHREPDGKCCCDNSQELKRLAGEIKSQLKEMK